MVAGRRRSRRGGPDGPRARPRRAGARIRAALAALLTLAGAGIQAATLDILVDKSEQEMTVVHEGELIHRWPVSTARPGKVTPNGSFAPQAFVRQHYSRLYNNAPMPWSIFYSGNYAIHGTTQTSRLGSVASAGCIRLHPDNARILFDLAREAGKENTRIIVYD